MRREITFNGKSNLSIPAYILKSAIFRGGGVKYETTEVPGRNGSLIYSDGTYSNLTIEYQIELRETSQKTLVTLTDEVKDWIYPLTDKYYRLEDSEDPNHFRLAQYAGDFDLDSFLLRLGKGTITLNCKPQRFLKSGEAVVTFTESGSLTDPTPYPAKPLLKVYGAGTVGLGDETITIAEGATEYVEIDTETCLCTEGTTDRSSLVALSDDWSKYVIKGETGITLDGVTKVEVTPRYWRK